jgi:hypothetical protein
MQAKPCSKVLYQLYSCNCGNCGAELFFSYHGSEYLGGIPELEKKLDLYKDDLFVDATIPQEKLRDFKYDPSFIYRLLRFFKYGKLEKVRVKELQNRWVQDRVSNPAKYAHHSQKFDGKCPVCNSRLICHEFTALRA